MYTYNTYIHMGGVAVLRSTENRLVVRPPSEAGKLPAEDSLNGGKVMGTWMIFPTPYPHH